MSRSTRSVLTALLLLAALLLLVPAALAAQSPWVPETQGPGASGPHASATAGRAAPAATQVAKLVAPGGGIDDFMGHAVAVDGDIAIVSAPNLGNVVNGVSKPITARGAVFVYKNIAGVWTLQQTLELSDPGSQFGTSVALEGDTIVVGAPYYRIDGVDCGAAFVFTSINGVWTQRQVLAVPGAGASWSVGTSLDLSGDQLIVGAEGAYPTATTSGAAYIYSRSGGLWSQTAELTATPATAGYQSGWSVGISGDSAMIGSWITNDGDGRVWVFTRTGGAWSQTQVLDPATGSRGQLGARIVLSGDTAYVDANAETVGANEWQGAVHIYTRTAGAWAETQTLTLSDGAAWDEFGVGLAISGDALVSTVLRAAEGGTAWRGEGYVFIRKAGVWERQAQTLTASDLFTSSVFGMSAALDGGTAVVGAPAEYPPPFAPGAAYVYTLTDSITPSVSGGHGTVSPATAQSVPLGDTPTFTFTPEAGYAVDQVLVDGAAVEVTGDAYTFAPVYADHSLAVGFYNASGPTTTIKGAPRGWSRHPVRLKFKATPAVDGKPVDFVEYKVDGKKWRHGTSVTVRRTGETKVQARATDTRGNVGPVTSATVRIDDVTPVVVGYGRPLGGLGDAMTLRFKVKDAATKTVTAMLAVTRYHYPVEQYDLGVVATGRKITKRLALGLPVGTWSWRIVVRDPAGIRGLCRWRYLDVTP